VLDFDSKSSFSNLLFANLEVYFCPNDVECPASMHGGLQAMPRGVVHRRVQLGILYPTRVRKYRKKYDYSYGCICDISVKSLWSVD
jgi:hypothetical protein